MKLSARNQFKGKIIDIQEGAVNGIVKIDIGAGNVMSATISMNAIRSSVSRSAAKPMPSSRQLPLWLVSTNKHSFHTETPRQN